MTYLDTNQRLMIETQVTARRKSIGLAYVLWFFLGLLSIHRFYLERPGTAILQILLNCVLVGLIWTLIDAFLIPGMIRDLDNKTRAELYRYAGGVPVPGAPTQSYVPQLPDMSRWSERDKANWFAAHPEYRRERS